MHILHITVDFNKPVTKHSVPSGLSKACSFVMSYHFEPFCISSEKARETSLFSPLLTHQHYQTDASASPMPKDRHVALNALHTSAGSRRKQQEHTGHKQKSTHAQKCCKTQNTKQLYGSYSTKLLLFLRQLRADLIPC